MSDAHASCLPSLGEPCGNCHRCAPAPRRLCDPEPAPTATYFVEPDGEDEPTIWRHNPDRPDYPEAILRRFVAPEAFDLLAATLRDAAHLRTQLLWQGGRP